VAPLSSCMGFLHEMRLDKDIRYHYNGGHLNLCAIFRSNCEANAMFDSATQSVLRENR
jgi:hypothetical protein